MNHLYTIYETILHLYVAFSLIFVAVKTKTHYKDHDYK